MLTVVVSVESGHGHLANTATVTSSTQDPNPANDQDTATVDLLDPSTIEADLSVRKTVDTTSPSVGDTVTYEIVVRNGGPGDATGVEISDRLPASLAYVSSHATVGSYDETTGIWHVGDLSAGDTATLSLRATITKDAAGTSIENVAQVAGLHEHDTKKRNDSDRQDVKVASDGDPGVLAWTGASVANGLGLALVFFLAGLFLLLAARRVEREEEVTQS